MNKATREVITLQVHAELIHRMAEATRTIFLLTGRVPDQMVLVHALELALQKQSERIGSTASVYSPAELNIRKEIAREVVDEIRRSVERSQA